MARNKYPDETVKKILAVSYRLFRDKGYDHTTIQDIVNELGMSKGAVYHHFKSKEEILNRINEQYYDELSWYKDIRLDPGLSGLDKLRAILCLQFTDERKQDMDNVLDSNKNPRLIAMILNATINEAAPFFTRLIEEGIADGSITVKQPKEICEAFLLLANIWVGMFTSSLDDFINKLDFIKELTDKLGMPIIDDGVRRACLGYFDNVMSLKKQG